MTPIRPAATPAVSCGVIVVCGVSGSGKSTIGRALATRLSLPFQEGDEFHPAENVTRMRSGRPLDDASRRQWLDRIAAWIDTHLDRGGVITCSALRKIYRQRLAQGRRDRVRFVLLQVPSEILEQRVRHRPGHFMPAALLPSQLAILEMPRAEEGVFVIPVADQSIGAVVDHVLLRMSGRPDGGDETTGPAIPRRPR